MSVTTTDNARITTVRHLLADYDLPHSQPSDAEAQPAPPPPDEPSLPEGPPSSNPSGWEDRWRRVPAYRPMINQLDDEHEVYQNEIEHNFVRVMFGGKCWEDDKYGQSLICSSGVSMMSTASHWWRATGGKINSDYFKFKIGGEW